MSAIDIAFDPNRDALQAGLSELRREALDLRRRDRLDLVCAPSPRWALRGRVSGPQGGSNVVVVLKSGRGRMSATSKEGGRFVFADLPSQPCRIQALTLLTETGQVPISSPEHTWGPGRTGPLELSYEIPPPTQTRRVRLAVRDAAGDPLAGVHVGAWTRAGLELRTRSDRLGLADFEVTTSVLRLSLEPAEANLVPVHVDLPPGDQDAPLQVVLYRLATLELEVEVPGIAPSQVYAWQVPRGKFAPIASPVTAGRARWAIQVAARPDLVLVVRAPGRLPVTLSLPGPPSGPITLTLPARPGLSLAGRVLAADGVPIAGASIELVSGLLKRTIPIGTSGPGGNF